MPEALRALGIMEYPIQVAFHTSVDLVPVLFSSEMVDNVSYMPEDFHEEAYLPASEC